MRLLLLLLACLFVSPAFAQKTYIKPPTTKSVRPDQLQLNPEAIQKINQFKSSSSSERQLSLKQVGTFAAQANTLAPSLNSKRVIDPHTGLPIYLEGHFDLSDQVQTRNNIPQATAHAFLNTFKKELQLRQPESEFKMIRQSIDKKGVTHTRLAQYYQDLPVYGTEVIVHSKEKEVLLFNGRYFATPKITSTTPKLSADQAIQISQTDLAKASVLIEFTPQIEELAGEPQVSKKELCIYFSDPAGKQAHLAYEILTSANPLEKWTYIIDAQTGDILKKYNRVCTLDHNHGEEDHHHNINWSKLSLPKAASANTLADGPRTANAVDLSGTNRTINTYEVSGNFYLLDGSRNMWEGFSPGGDRFSGGIYTATGDNKPLDEDFEPKDIASNNNSWNNPAGVSAHFNAGMAYEYFRQTFGRNSINGSGGNIISFINIADDDGGGLDNAFWNGSSMFYGDGDFAFSSLAEALDVAGHEMSHGVIQETSNLEYQGESGALNESYADIFGTMIDRDDWLLGEDVVNRQVFRSGALRNMMDPNNGGFSLNDRGWQPAHVNEQFFGSEDNGGVHINSGIHNKAFYLVANQLGRDRAEQIFYKTLDQYLTRSSQFIDARLATIRSAQEEYGNNAAAAVASAFDQVGIIDGTPTAPPEEATPNEGQQYLLLVGEDNFGLYITDLNGASIVDGGGPLVSDNILYKPSISDDGSRILYINENNQLRVVLIDWAADRYEIVNLSDDPVWRRAAISKDGLKGAVTTTDQTPDIIVFDINTGNGFTFELYNPTTAEGGVNSGDVKYADALEWDLSSQYVIYDAFNEVSSLFSDYSYYDIGSIFVWDNQTDQPGDGLVEKLFASLPDDVSIGNPAISKNSPNILVFDLINFNTNETAILAVDIETGMTGTVANTTNLGFPNYSVQDDYILYEKESDSFFGGIKVVATPLSQDKINAANQDLDVVSGYRFPNWFATGTRVITNIRERINPDQLSFSVMPNPSTQNILVSTTLEKADNIQFEVYDMMGKLWYQHQTRAAQGLHQSIIPVEKLPAGTYVLKMRMGQSITAQKIVKQ